MAAIRQPERASQSGQPKAQRHTSSCVHRGKTGKTIMSQAIAPHAAPTEAMRPNEFNLIWVDMEMTGLNPETDRIIEVAVVVTDSNLNILAEGPVFAIHQADEILDGMDAWNKGTHGRSGLIDRVKASSVSEADAEAALIAFLKKFVPTGKSPMCGNSICQDRRFMARGMPKLEAFFHYRNLDVSTLKELCKRWKPELASGFKKHQKHTALADIIESIEELRYYREHFIKA
jgi:oligoribonuclease